MKSPKFIEPAPLAACFAIVGRLYAIVCALDYDMTEHKRLHGGSVPAPVWESNMRAWTLARGGEWSGPLPFQLPGVTKFPTPKKSP